MINSIIRTDENTYIVKRILNEQTSEEMATQIHKGLGTDTLLRNKEGKWFCCLNVKDVVFRDVEVISTTESEDLSHTNFELGDNGGLG